VSPTGRVQRRQIRRVVGGHQPRVGGALPALLTCAHECTPGAAGLDLLPLPGHPMVLRMGRGHGLGPGGGGLGHRVDWSRGPHQAASGEMGYHSQQSVHLAGFLRVGHGQQLSWEMRLVGRGFFGIRECYIRRGSQMYTQQFYPLIALGDPTRNIPA